MGQNVGRINLGERNPSIYDLYLFSSVLVSQRASVTSQARYDDSGDSISYRARPSISDDNTGYNHVAIIQGTRQAVPEGSSCLSSGYPHELS